MKILISTLCVFFALNLGHAQTGSLVTDVDFIRDIQCATYNLKLSKSDTTLLFSGIREKDTLTDIPTGLYNALFYSCDSSFSYSQKIEIIQDQKRYFEYQYAPNVEEPYEESLIYDDDYFYDYYDDSTSNPSFFNIGIQFSRGIFLDNANNALINNFAFDYITGNDILVTNPIAVGYELGFGYTQANYIAEDLQDPLITHEKQRFTTFDLSLAFITSIYIKDRRFLGIGARYRLPYFARYARVTGDEKISTKGLHRYNDFSVFAQLGYDWGFIYAEYRFDQILKSPLGDLPNFSLGVRLNVTSDN